MPLLGMSAPALRPAHIEGIGLAAPGESSRTGNCRWSRGGQLAALCVWRFVAAAFSFGGSQAFTLPRP